jgi:DNA (cytosine-5)-methyltransferase 1
MADWSSFAFIDLFAGIGGMRIAFERIGGRCVFSSEWDEQAQTTYAANFGERPAGDIRHIPSADIPSFDVLVAGFPCQPFSIIGAREGFMHETQGTLFFEIERILKDRLPSAFLLENVRNLVAHNDGRTFRTIIRHLEAIGYNVYSKVLNALDFGLPQKRERIIICGFRDQVDFRFPISGTSKPLTLADILDPNADADPCLKVKPAIRASRLARLKTRPKKPYVSHENVGGSVTPHPYCCALRAGASANYVLINDARRLSPREMLRLQGFPDDFKVVVSYSGIRKQTGNSVAIPVIEAVAREMVRALRRKT